MSTERVVTDNELICDFMGLKHRKEFGPLTGEEYTSVKLTDNANWLICHYDTSLEWLMPVFKLLLKRLKLENWPTRELKEWANAQTGRVERKFWDYVYDGCTLPEFTAEIAEVIKWYNPNSPIKENSPEDGVRKHE